MLAFFWAVILSRESLELNILKTKSFECLGKPTSEKFPFIANYFRFMDAVDDQFFGPKTRINRFDFRWIQIHYECLNHLKWRYHTNCKKKLVISNCLVSIFPSVISIAYLQFFGIIFLPINEEMGTISTQHLSKMINKINLIKNIQWALIQFRSVVVQNDQQSDFPGPF